MTTTKLSHPVEANTSPNLPDAPPEVDPLADIVAGTSTTALTQRAPGGLRSPLWRLNVTSSFGERTHPVLGSQRFHRGLDYGARTGTAVRAAAGGTSFGPTNSAPTEHSS